MRRTIIAVALLLGFVGSAQAGAPRLLETQGVLYDSEGAPANALVSLAFTLYDGREGAALWSEIQEIPVTGGVFAAVLGAQPDAPFPADLFTAHEELWLGVQVEAEPELPRQRLVSVAYALEAAHAAVADVALGIDCVGCVGVDQLAVAPASQAALDALAARVAALETAVAGLGGARLATLGCGADAVPRFDGDAWVCDTGLATRAELEAIAVESVDGLLGGTIGSDTAVAGTLSAPTILQDGNVVCDASGNCGPTLADLDCGPDQIVQHDGAAWTCAAVPTPGVPTEPCVGDGKALQWDGAAWVCVDTKRAGLSRGEANGFELVDPWGDTWDGIERGAATFAEAQAACVADGGRLPTPTELWRNNSGDGTGALGTTADSSYLWTLITERHGDKATVRLSDGTVSYAAVDTALPYRCVWPAATSDAFTEPYCHGPKGAGCVPVRRFYNMDAAHRAPLDYVAASRECNFYNASLPTIEDWTEAIHAGALAGSFEWLWSVGVMYYGASYGRVLMPIVRFDEASEAHFAYSGRYNGQLGGWNWPHQASYFRCIGKRSAAIGVDPYGEDDPPCQDGCFTMAPSADQSPDHPGRRAPIWADRTDRAPTTQAEAAAACAALGGSLPNVIEAQELIHAGWTMGSDEYLWTSSGFNSTNYYSVLVKWAEAGAANWFPYYNSWLSWNDGTGSFGYRCVWHQTFRAEAPTCPPGQAPRFDDDAFSCVAIADGDDGGAATDGGWTDPWGNRWDATPRPEVTYPAAVETCSLLGGRLPTATEVWRVKGDAATPLPGPSGAWAWTGLPSYRLDYAIVVRETTGETSDGGTAPTDTARPVRCIWPASHGNVLGGRACTGDAGTAAAPTDTCLRLGRTTVDPFNRARLAAAAAAEECYRAGGWMADLRTVQGLIHAGLPNGEDGQWTWLMESGASSGGNYWLYAARWTGTGDETWWWNNTVASTAGGLWPDRSDVAFRCVFHDLIR